MNKNKNVYIFNHWWNLNNYGAVLTAFALQNLIGENSYLVSDKEYKFTSMIDRKYTFSLPFKEKYLKTLTNLNTNSDYLALNDSACAFVTGSDQVFRGAFLKNNRLDEYLFNFAEFDKKKIAFSASFGKDKEEFLNETDEITINKMQSALKSFDFISVREKSGVEICRDIFDIKAEWIIDPVFVLDKEKFEELADKSSINYGGKIVSYVLDTNKNYKKAYKFLAEKYGRQVTECANSNISIENWIASIRDCELFITDSFHGMCFALIFNKPFICITNKSRGSSRFESICEMLGIENQCINSIDEIYDNDCVFKIDYDALNKNIEKERARALEFLNRALSAPVCLSEQKAKVRAEYLENCVKKLETQNNLKYQFKKYLWDNWVIIFYHLPLPVRCAIRFIKRIFIR